MFVHLRLHSEFSVVDSTCRIDDVVKIAAKDGQPALAITDLNNLFGGVKFYKEGRGKGVKPILGAEINLEGLGGDLAALSRVVVLVQSHQGYLNICELLARACSFVDPHLHKWLHRIDVPVQIVWGDSDKVFPLPFGENLHRVADKNGIIDLCRRQRERYYAGLAKAGLPD